MDCRLKKIYSVLMSFTRNMCKENIVPTKWDDPDDSHLVK